MAASQSKLAWITPNLGILWTSVCSFWLQLFRQRLSHKSVKACATMSIGIMGSKSLVLLDWGLRLFNNKERERRNTRVCAVPSTTLKHLEVQSSNRKTTITHNDFRYCRASFSPFVRQPFTKQLYVDQQLLIPYFTDSYLVFHGLKSGNANE